MLVPVKLECRCPATRAQDYDWTQIAPPYETYRRYIRYRGADRIRGRSRNGVLKFVWALLSCVRGTQHAACSQRLPEDNLDNVLYRNQGGCRN